MTRLRAQEMAAIARDLNAYDRELRDKTGVALRGLACQAAGICETEFVKRVIGLSAAVVPIGWGEGVIPGFAAAVQRIVRHLGLGIHTVDKSGVSGLAQAYAGGSDLIFLADDAQFIAINTHDRSVADNAEATGAGFAWGLHLMAGGVAGKPVLVLGCGAVGFHAARALLKIGATVSLYDRNARASERCRRQLQAARTQILRVESHLEQALHRHRLLLDATPAAGFIGEEHLHSDSLVGAPGVPLGLTAPAAERLANRLLHDRLEIGVATMVAAAVKGSVIKKRNQSRSTQD
jgi:pyrrolysine biosynthesis protein PylD